MNSNSSAQTALITSATRSSAVVSCRCALPITVMGLDTIGGPSWA